MNQLIIFLPPILMVFVYVLQIIIQTRKLNHLRQELKETKVIINDTTDLRNAIFHDLEGLWSFVGRFTKFQNNNAQYNSVGYLILNWIPSGRNYNAIYCYSVSKAGEDIQSVTAICKGHSEGDLFNKNLLLRMEVVSRTDLSSQANYSRSFTLELKINSAANIVNITSKFETPMTVGKLTFSKVS
jgi:hypothetical protein